MAGTLEELPRLREDLQLHKAGPSYGGAPAWVVHDPAAGKFFRLSFEMFQIFTVWNKSKTPADLAKNLEDRYGRRLAQGEFEAALQTIEQGQLFDVPATGGWRALHGASRPRHGAFMGLVHNYLFFKIPLVRPQRFLDATWPVARLFFSRGFLFVCAALGLIGAYVASRQWDAFVNALPYFFTPAGIAVSIASVVFVKSLHELGHGYIAHRHGCRVPTMGLAFMLLTPMLYTDVSDAWKLRSRKERILIDSAGLVVELCLGMVCLFLWAFLPDGPLRSAVFVMATVSWIMSLAFNLNPLMRFDGYYIASDLLGVPNLQHRCFTHFGWRLRRFLFGISEEPPEVFPRRIDIALTLYAVATALYRLVLYIGIALIVYHFFIKVVGIGLFLVEVVFFIVRPVWLEFKRWWLMRKTILSSPRTYVSAGFAAAAVAACFMPLSATVYAPAVLSPEQSTRLYSVAPARVVAIHVAAGQAVTSGEILFTLEAPSLAYERRMAETEVRLRQLRIGRAAADRDAREERQVLLSELASFQSKLKGLDALERQLVIRAPFAGRVAELNARLYPGRWVSRREELGLLASAATPVTRGYVDGDDLPRIVQGGRALFVPDDISAASSDFTLRSISLAGATQIDLAELSSLYGGSIATVEAPDRRIVPLAAHYAVTAQALNASDAPDQTRRGMLLISAKAESFASRAWRRILKVLVRESGA